jgi:hypothetical protein
MEAFARCTSKTPSSWRLIDHKVFRSRLAQMKLVEQLTLVTLQTAHHGSTSPRFASTKRNHASRLLSTDFYNKICQKPTSAHASYSIISSARASSLSGMLRPSAFAVFIRHQDKQLVVAQLQAFGEGIPCKNSGYTQDCGRSRIAGIWRHYPRRSRRFRNCVGKAAPGWAVPGAKAAEVSEQMLGRIRC